MGFKDYQLVTHINYQQFENFVKQGLANGWGLVGGICVTYGNFNDLGQVDPNGKPKVIYSQAMAK